MANIITDAELVNQFAKRAMEEPEEQIVTRAPSDSEVKLPGGFLKGSELITTAEVKELNGADEEAISKAGGTGKSLQVLLQRGLLKLGTHEVAKEDLDMLLAGDRDAILIGVRCVTFGENLDLTIRCPHCGDEQATSVNLVDDVPVKKLANPVEDRQWEVQTKLGTAVVSLPNGIVQRKLMENIDKTAAEINTLLLAGCIVSIDGLPSVGNGAALALSMADRNAILDSIIDRNPGPRLGEVKKACKACGESVDLPLSLVDLFRI